MAVIQSRSWTMSASLKNVDHICADIGRMLADLNLNSHSFALEILAREALNNAILHGNLMDPQKKIHAALCYDGGGLQLTVGDEGAGFDWKSVLDREMVPDDRENGRGLKLYRMYADHVEFNETGNQVKLTRKIDRVVTSRA